jgi:hypothetical protein
MDNVKIEIYCDQLYHDGSEPTLGEVVPYESAGARRPPGRLPDRYRWGLQGERMRRVDLRSSRGVLAMRSRIRSYVGSTSCSGSGSARDTSRHRKTSQAS